MGRLGFQRLGCGSQQRYARVGQHRHALRVRRSLLADARQISAYLAEGDEAI
jgi:hypothetical protein